MGKSRICFGLFVCFHCFLSVYFVLVYIHQVIFKFQHAWRTKLLLQTRDPRRSRRFRVYHVSWGLSACGFSSWLCVLSAHRDMNPETWMSTYEKFYKAIFSFQGNSGRKVMPKLEGVWSHMGCDPASPPSLLCSPVCFYQSHRLVFKEVRQRETETKTEMERDREKEREKEGRRTVTVCSQGNR